MIHNKNQLRILKIGIGSSMIVGLGPLKLHKQTRKDNHHTTTNTTMSKSFKGKGYKSYKSCKSKTQTSQLNGQILVF